MKKQEIEKQIIKSIYRKAEDAVITERSSYTSFYAECDLFGIYVTTEEEGEETIIAQTSIDWYDEDCNIDYSIIEEVCAELGGLSVCKSYYYMVQAEREIRLTEQILIQTM